MTGIQLRYAVGNVGEALQGLLRCAAHPAPMLDEIGNSLGNSTRHRFESGRDPDGQPWAPSRRAQDQGGQTLLDTGHLRDSITHTANATSAAVGSNLIYAGIHQFGGTIAATSGRALRFPVGAGWATVKSVSLPARPFLGVDTDDEAEIGAIIQDYLGGGLTGAGA